jgi:hypothetical protein
MILDPQVLLLERNGKRLAKEFANVGDGPKLGIVLGHRLPRIASAS